jgi:hypothetical protein
MKALELKNEQHKNIPIHTPIEVRNKENDALFSLKHNFSSFSLSIPLTHSSVSSYQAVGRVACRSARRH